MNYPDNIRDFNDDENSPTFDGVNEEEEKPWPDEPAWTVNGVKLTNGQAMTVRVALQTFGISLSHSGLGDDPSGYLAQIRSINEIMAS